MITKNTAKNNLKKAVLALIVTLTMVHAKEGVYIKEPFSCDVALADLKELQRAVKETHKSDFKYKIFLEELEAVKNSLKKHSECSATKGGK